MRQREEKERTRGDKTRIGGKADGEAVDEEADEGERRTGCHWCSGSCSHVWG